MQLLNKMERKSSGLILQAGHEGDCLHAPLAIVLVPLKCSSRNIYNFLILTPCTRVTRGDWCHAHHVGGQSTCINAASPKMRTSLHNAQHNLCIELYMKTHSEIAHQYGAFKIFLMMPSGEMGQ